MPPKQKSPKQLGDVNEYGDGWRVVAKIDGKQIQGPKRRKKGQAQNDLLSARRCETRQEMGLFLLALHGIQPLAGPSREDLGAQAAASRIANEPGSASSATNFSVAVQSPTHGRSAAQKRADRLRRETLRQRSEAYKIKKRVRENTLKYKFAQNLRRKLPKYKERKRAYEENS